MEIMICQCIDLQDGRLMNKYGNANSPPVLTNIAMENGPFVDNKTSILERIFHCHV